MDVLEVYERYKIMPQLQEHQLRVAAVAKQICDNFTEPVDSETVVKACLLHDMGNILKFDLGESLPEFLEPKGRDYWEGVKKETAHKYGSDEHKASVEIARELGMDETVIKCIESIDFAKELDNARVETDIRIKICDTADLRVDPHGVVSMAQRLEEGAKRYKQRPDKWLTEEKRQKVVEACFLIERQIFEKCKIKPQDITNESTKPIIERLRAYKI
jgi:putative nucleotidyltransferase with HDIG domain